MKGNARYPSANYEYRLGDKMEQIETWTRAYD
jgi:hypothetical protein